MSEESQPAELLRQGIAAAKAGRKEEAHETLLQVIKLDERNEQAWLWLSAVVDSIEEKEICLENVLALNPANAQILNAVKVHLVPETCNIRGVEFDPRGNTFWVMYTQYGT
jgi:Flp pilus assembly protein TadD